MSSVLKKLLLIFYILAVLTDCGFRKKIAVKFLLPAAVSSSSPSVSSGTMTGLTPSAGSLSPAFSASVLNYTMTVGFSVSSLNFTPVSNDSFSIIKINGTQVSSGSASASISISVGANTVTVDHTNSAGTKTSYTITVTRNSSLGTVSTLSSLSGSVFSLSPSFSSGTVSYTSTVSNSISSITITPAVTESTSTVTVNGTAVASGSASGNISLSTGANAISVTVTAEDGSTTVYTVTVTKLGATMKRLFVTSSTHNGALGGIAGADAKCNADSNKPSDGSTYSAVLVNGVGRIACNGTSNCTLISENTNWSIGASLNFVRASDGAALFTSNTAGIYSFGTLANPIESSGSRTYWTGLTNSWNLSGSHCTLWVLSLGTGQTGDSSQTGTGAIATGTANCNTFKSLLCAEQ